MNIYAPTQPHAATERGGYCAVHEGWEDAPLRGGGGRVWRDGETSGRLWRVTGELPVVAANLVPLGLAYGAMRRPPNTSVLAPGVLLRLDREITDHIFFWDVSDTMRRFCVLDGPLAGTCWQGWERVGDKKTTDPVEPVGDAAR